MQENQTDLLTESVLQISTKKRRELLPWWIKVFMWIFLIFGALIPFVVLIGIFGYSGQLSLYGLETNEPLSIIGISVTTIFLIKGITAYGLLKEKHWAIKLGIADSILGISICTFLMIYPLLNTETKFVFRLELLLLIPYLLKLLKIKFAWENTIEI